MTTTKEQRKARRDLINFLTKLRFKKAETAGILETIQSSFGTPDMLIWSPYALSAYQTIFNSLQTEDTAEPEQSSKVPCGDKAQ